MRLQPEQLSDFLESITSDGHPLTKLQEPTDDWLLHELRSMLPAPVQEETSLDGSIVMVAGCPAEIVLTVRGPQVSVQMYAAEWSGTRTLTVKPQTIAVLHWRRLLQNDGLSVLQQLNALPSAARRSEFRRCERCGKTTPPENLYDKARARNVLLNP